MPTIESQDLRLTDLFRDFYVVPSYQREYVWQEDQVDQLLRDIRSEQAYAGESEYFIGSIVTCPGVGGKLDLIDGQQRMTTLFVTLCAIRDRLEALGDKGTSVIRRMIAEESTDSWGNDVFQPRLDPQYEDAGDVFAKLVDGRPPSKSAPTRSMRNVANSYYTTVSFLADEFGDDVGALRAFYGYLINKVKLIRIRTDSIARALKIFETINDRGVGLDAMDLLKNLLFMKSAHDQFTKLKDEWKALTDGLYQAGEKPLRFLRYFILSTYGVTKLREDELYGWLIKNESSVGFGADPIGFVRHLKAALGAYLNFLKGRGPDGQIHPAIESLTILAGKATRQHLILLLSARNCPDDILAALCRDAESLIFVYAVCRQTSREFEVLFPEWALALPQISTIEEYEAFSAITFRKRRSELATRFARDFPNLDGRSLKQFQLRYVLGKLTQYVDLLAFGATSEGHRWLSRYCDGGSLQIEHILSQKVTPAIRSEFGDGSDDPNVIWAIGNLTLVEKSINASLGNAPFSVKKTVYPKSQHLLTRGISEKPEIGRTAIDRATDQIEPFSDWSKEAVAARSAMLGALAEQIWDAPALQSNPARISADQLYREADRAPILPNTKLPPIFGASAVSAPPPRPRARAIMPEGTKGRLIADAAHEALTRLSRPISSSELLVELDAMGVEVGGQRPTSNLGAHLSNDPRFRFDTATSCWVLDSSTSA